MLIKVFGSGEVFFSMDTLLFVSGRVREDIEIIHAKPVKQ